MSTELSWVRRTCGVGILPCHHSFVRQVEVGFCEKSESYINGHRLEWGCCNASTPRQLHKFKPVEPCGPSHHLGRGVTSTGPLPSCTSRRTACVLGSGCEFGRSPLVGSRHIHRRGPDLGNRRGAAALAALRTPGLGLQRIRGVRYRLCPQWEPGFPNREASLYLAGDLAFRSHLAAQRPACLHGLAVLQCGDLDLRRPLAPDSAPWTRTGPSPRPRPAPGHVASPPPRRLNGRVAERSVDTAFEFGQKFKPTGVPSPTKSTPSYGVPRSRGSAVGGDTVPTRNSPLRAHPSRVNAVLHTQCHRI